MNLPTLFDQDWQHLLQLLPPNRDQAARDMGAFTRKRQIQTPDDLLRLAFVYVWGDLSLRNTSAWAAHKQVATLSDVALLERLQKAEVWLGWLLGQMLCTQCACPNLADLPYRVRLVDASVICQPGSKGTDWRVHIEMNLLSQTTQTLHLTDAHGGETFTRYRVHKDDLLVGDRCYGNRAGIAHVVEAGGQVLVRFVAQNLPLNHLEGTPFDLQAALEAFQEGPLKAWEVYTVALPEQNLPAVRGRLLVLRKDSASAQAARHRAQKNAQKKGHRVQELTLLCGDFVLLFTTVPKEQASAEVLLALYRFRWQIECGFKRLKSILHLDALPAHDPRLCRAWLYTKLLGALLVERFASSWASFSPWLSPRAGSLGVASVADDLALAATGGGDRDWLGRWVERSVASQTKVLRTAA